MTIIQFKARQRKAQKKVNRCVDGIKYYSEKQIRLLRSTSRKKLKEVIKQLLENGWQ